MEVPGRIHPHGCFFTNSTFINPGIMLKVVMLQVDRVLYFIVHVFRFMYGTCFLDAIIFKFTCSILSLSNYNSHSVRIIFTFKPPCVYKSNIFLSDVNNISLLRCGTFSIVVDFIFLSG